MFNAHRSAYPQCMGGNQTFNIIFSKPPCCHNL